MYGLVKDINQSSSGAAFADTYPIISATQSNTGVRELLSHGPTPGSRLVAMDGHSGLGLFLEQCCPTKRTPGKPEEKALTWLPADIPDVFEMHYETAMGRPWGC